MALDRIIELLPDILAGACTRPSTLHGDLWVGNTGALGAGDPVVFDPATFFGDAEFDLALASMFGGLDERFFDAYHAHNPRTAGFETRRRAYRLYHYLNQLNLFGDPKVCKVCMDLCQALANPC